jgi:hypothetical protein
VLDGKETQPMQACNALLAMFAIAPTIIKVRALCGELIYSTSWWVKMGKRYPATKIK